MFNEPITIVDIETTGGSTYNSRILEIAAIRIENGIIVKEFQSLINPGTAIPSFITGITGISDKDIVNAPYFDEIASEIADIFDGALFMAHNVLFDFSFIKKQMESCGYSFKPRLLCSVKLSRALNPAVKGHSLEKIINRHGIEVSSRHRAYDDANAVLSFIKLMVETHGDEIVSEALQKQLKLKSLPSNFDEGQLTGIGNEPGVYIFKDADNLPVYIGKSVNLRNRILSHFAQSSIVGKELKISQNTHKLEIIKTDNELEALLLESKLIKEMLPAYNIKLRRKKEQTVLTRRKNADGYYEIQLVESNVSSYANPEEIFGVYSNRTKAKEALQNARKTFDLCSKFLGLESPKGACFHYQLKKCRGACTGLENVDIYNLRMDLAFERSRVATWKYKSPIALKLSDKAGLVLDHWKVIGKITDTDSGSYDFEKYDSSFDMDSYKILNSFISKNRDKVIKLNVTNITSPSF